MTPVPAPKIEAPVEPHLITSGEDRFLCQPYACILSAKACVDRQATVAEGFRTVDFEKCADCALGRTVRERAGVTADLEQLVGREKKRLASVRRGRKHRDEGRPLALCVLPNAEANTARPFREKALPVGDGRLVSDIDGREIVTAREEQQPMAKEFTDEQKARRREYMKAYHARKKAEGGRRAKAPSKPRKSASVRNGARSVTFEQAVEAVHLVETIGWDTVRQLAARLGQ